MEPDGVTRVYFLREGRLAELYPVNRIYRQSLEGKAAEEVLTREDFRCTGYEVDVETPIQISSRGGLRVIVKEYRVQNLANGAKFKIDRKIWEEGYEYSNLASLIEDRYGVSGFTIVVD